MTRRRFAFWIGLGLFQAAERTGATALDEIAAAVMHAVPADPPAPAAAAEPIAGEMPVHWQTTHNRTWRWVQREHYVDGEWTLTGMTTPVRRDDGAPLDGAEGYLPDAEVPEAYRTAYDALADANDEPVLLDTDEGVSTVDDNPGPDAAPHRRARHGRPPSRWLRSLHAGELAIWLATVDPPQATVEGMTFAEHLTRDHHFAAERIKGLADDELAKLHAAAHHGY